MLRTSTDIKSRMKDGKPVIDVNLKGEANIADVECQVNLQDPAMITELEKKRNMMCKIKCEEQLREHKTNIKVMSLGLEKFLPPKRKGLEQDEKSLG